MSDDNDPTTENRLRRALAARDAEVEPSRDALAAIQGRSAPSGLWRRVPMLAAAALVLVGGIIGAAVLLDGDGEPDLATDQTTATVTPTSAEPTETPPPTSVTVPPTTIPSPARALELLAENGLVVWPRDSRSFPSMEAAASAYVTEVLEVDDPTLVYECCDGLVGHARLQARGEGGSELDHDAAVMTLVDLGGTWDIVLVESEAMVIEDVDSTADAQLLVSGSGLAFEGTGILTATSRCDPEEVASLVVAVGAGAGGEHGPFSEVITAPECDVVILQLAAPAIGEGETPSVASIAFRPSTPDVVVMRVGADDVLNVRAGPNAEAEVVATLPPDGSGIRPTGAQSDDGWWEISTPDGTIGWVNSAFLSVQLPLDDDLAGDLVFAAMGLVEWLDEDVPSTSPTTRPPPPPPLFSPLGVDIGGIGIFPDAPTPFVRIPPADVLSPTTFDWNPFREDGSRCDPSDCDLTVADFLDFDVDDREKADYVAGPVVHTDESNSRFLIGLPDEYAERFAAVRVEIPASSDQELDWRTYTVIFDFRSSAPEIIALYRWGWTP